MARKVWSVEVSGSANSVKQIGSLNRDWIQNCLPGQYLREPCRSLTLIGYLFRSKMCVKITEFFELDACTFDSHFLFGSHSQQSLCFPRSCSSHVSTPVPNRPGCQAYSARSSSDHLCGSQRIFFSFYRSVINAVLVMETFINGFTLASTTPRTKSARARQPICSASSHLTQHDQQHRLHRGALIGAAVAAKFVRRAFIFLVAGLFCIMM